MIRKHTISRDDRIYIVNYIVDDAPKAQIRGYSVSMADFLLDVRQPGV